MPYLFVHFREKKTSEGEQVHFAVSQDGFSWQALANGSPVLTTNIGDRGVRDMAILRTPKDDFVILATDLSLANEFTKKYHCSWEEIKVHGSHQLIKWTSSNLIDWSPASAITVGDPNGGCVWAPDMIYDKKNDDYIIHWSAPIKPEADSIFAIFYSRTRDFSEFTYPAILYQDKNSSVIDSAIYEFEGCFYLFLKQEDQPTGIRLLTANEITGPYKAILRFEESLPQLVGRAYEAPTAAQLSDGNWYLFLDFYGSEDAEGQGYVLFMTDDLKRGEFTEVKEKVQFPYGFKHGSVLFISEDEYERISEHFKTDSFNR